jgi:hypothetical protein
MRSSPIRPLPAFLALSDLSVAVGRGSGGVGVGFYMWGISMYRAATGFALLEA